LRFGSDVDEGFREGVVVRLDRTTRYSEAHPRVMCATEYRMPACAGMTSQPDPKSTFSIPVRMF
jgi:hypothetical protein